jgi:hypothetical protein
LSGDIYDPAFVKGVSFTAGPVEIGFDADTTFFRDDVRNQRYRGRVGVRF